MITIKAHADAVILPEEETTYAWSKENFMWENEVDEMLKVNNMWYPDNKHFIDSQTFISMSFSISKYGIKNLTCGHNFIPLFGEKWNLDVNIAHTSNIPTSLLIVEDGIFCHVVYESDTFNVNIPAKLVKTEGTGINELTIELDAMLSLTCHAADTHIDNTSFYTSFYSMLGIVSPRMKTIREKLEKDKKEYDEMFHQ